MYLSCTSHFLFVAEQIRFERENALLKSNINSDLEKEHIAYLERSEKKFIEYYEESFKDKPLAKNQLTAGTDIIKPNDGDFFISDWLRNRNTLEYLGAWESMFNPDFNYGEFAIIKSKAGLNNFKISIKEYQKKIDSPSCVALQKNSLQF